MPASATQAAELALEEHLTNVFNYGYSDNVVHEIIVRFSVNDDWFQIEIEDDGRRFNPLERPPVDTSMPLEQRPIGGLGIHLIRKFMDELDYQRVDGKNVLRMRKKRAGES